MNIFDRLKVENQHKILIEKLEKHQHYHLEKLNILQVKKYYLLIREE